ncbi:hypothetical protein L9F63_012340, partial [Diploptera punctata]
KMAFVVKCAPVIKEWNYCCCSCSLRAASIVLAWIALVFNTAEFVTYLLWLVNPPESDLGNINRLDVARFMIGGAVAGIILDSLLLFGIHNKRPAYMLPYLVLCLIGIILYALAILAITVFTIIQSWLAGIIIFLVGCAILAVTTFFWVVLYSYYRQLEDEKNLPVHMVFPNCPEEDYSPPPYPGKTAEAMA